MIPSVTIILPNIIATKAFANKVASQLSCGDVVLLEGELGVGKTAFSAALIHALGNSEEVLSPTFSLLQSYPTQKGVVYHFDLYRIEEAEELVEIGLQDALDQGITILEWPQIAFDFLPDDALRIVFSFQPDDARCAVVTGKGKKWQGLVEQLSKEKKC